MLQHGEENCGKHGSPFSTILNAADGRPEKVVSLSQKGFKKEEEKDNKTNQKTGNPDKEKSLLGNQYEIAQPPPPLRLENTPSQMGFTVGFSSYFRQPISD